MNLRLLATLILFSSLSSADIITDVRAAIAQKNLAAAASELQNYRAQHGVDPQYLEAVSWMARGSLSANQLDQAETYAKQTETESRQLLQHRPFDAEPHLPSALGAALEVQAQVLALRGKNPQAVALLRRSLVTYRNTSIRARLQKNLNMLGLAGQPAPPFSTAEYLGIRPIPLAQLKGSPTLLFFWAHWCGDCKAEAPIITQLRSEYAPKGLKVIGPTRYYGYTAQEEHAAPADELKYIDAVRHRYYAGLLDMPVPINTANFNTYGASTTPTLVLVDRAGKVAWYHPGAVPYAELKAEIEKVVAR